MEIGASSQKAGKKSNTDFKFVTYEGPSHASTRKIRTQVRSHVSKWQHRRTRERLFAELQRGGDPSKAICEVDDDGNEVADEESGGSSTIVTPNARADQDQDDILAFTTTDSGKSKHPEKTTRQKHHRNETEEDFSHANEETAILLRRACHSALAKSFSQGTASFRTMALHDRDNVVGASLQTLHLELSSVMGLYSRICELQSMDFARQYAITKEGEGSWGRFYSFVFTDPILLSTAVLLGVRNQLEILGRGIQGQTSASVIHIQQFLMRSINDALTDPQRGVSDQMLVVVALCAAYEIKHGSGTYYHVHMQGLTQMVELRGGLKAIGHPDPYIARLLLWIDANTSRLAGCAPYLRYTPVKGISAIPEPNPKVFRTKGTMDG